MSLQLQITGPADEIPAFLYHVGQSPNIVLPLGPVKVESAEATEGETTDVCTGPVTVYLVDEMEELAARVRAAGMLDEADRDQVAAEA